MINCKNCSSPIEVNQGRRPREFCDNNQKCRNEFYRKNKKATTHKTIPIEQWNEIEKKLAAVPIIEIQDANEPTNVVKPKKPLGTNKTNFTINTGGGKSLTPYEEMLKKKRGF
jgi:hypothetical protein